MKSAKYYTIPLKWRTQPENRLEITGAAEGKGNGDSAMLTESPFRVKKKAWKHMTVMRAQQHECNDAPNCMFITTELTRCVFYRSFFKELGKTKTFAEGGTITILQELLTALQRKYKVIPRAASPSTRCPRPPPAFPSCTRARLTTSLTLAWSLLLEQVALVPEASAAAAAKSLQSCPTLLDPIDGSPPGSPAPGILQVRTLEWVAISFSNAWKWKVKVKSLSRVQLLATPWTGAYQAPPPMGFSRQEY